MKRKHLGASLTLFFLMGGIFFFLSCREAETGQAAAAPKSQVVTQQSTVDWKAARQHARFDDARLSQQQARTLKKALKPPHLSSHNVVIAKYFLRFIASGFIIFVLIAGHFVHPLGLIIGLSVVVCSIMLATLCEFKKLIFQLK